MDQVPTQTRHQLLPSTPFVIIKKQLCCSLSFVFILISSVVVFNLGGSFSQPLALFRFGFFPQKLIPIPHKNACDYSNGRWVRDNNNHSIQFYDENCPFLDPGFQCRHNGRKDVEYLKWRWQPHGCNLPRFNASDFLERSRNGRIVFAGDSIGRNQWESLICMLAQAVSNKSRIFEENGSPITKHKGFLSMKFQDYNLTVEYYRTPFLVVINRPPENSPAEVKVTVRVDEMHWFSQRWTGANVLVLNTGHWWNKEKTVKMYIYCLSFHGLSFAA
ncbi:hypothetical protein COLO4_29663 [Corchorus olitorius]|uniref:Uncharacterized protein n=1 Tax=Corchorus olitorius TaxID=93759 RepID=A0A1R3HDM6_9ROSI|nr:hypothetical protein COLO4_29663 [Corchorus olitorius]